MRVYVTGATGFVGSNVAKILGELHGAELCCPVHAWRDDGADAPVVDLTDPGQVLPSVTAFEPDAVVHCAILNDLATMLRDRRAAWDAYVGATRNVVDAANAVGAQVVLVSTDWVFDGTQHRATEDTPPNPVNIYGALKFACELVAVERARRPAVARVSGVNGVHWARPGAPRSQDAGFGYFVTSIVEALRAGEPFHVWESDEINMVASPSLASDCAELIWRILAGGHEGIFHCCGGEEVTRHQLALATTEAFGLDPALLRFGPPAPGALPRMPVPYDTSLDGAATAAALRVRLPDVADQLRRLRAQMDRGVVEPLATGAV